MKLCAPIFALVIIASSTSHATLVATTLASFTDPAVLTFQSTPLGNISGTSSIFTSIGISSVSAVASDFSDPYDIRPLGSRALWADAGGLRIVDPGTPNLAETVSYTMTFTTPRTKLGFAETDQAGTFTLSVFNGATLLDTINFTNSEADLEQFYFSDNVAFNKATITIAGGGGFALDNITVEAVSPIPEPTTAVFGLALVGACVASRRRAKAAVLA